jgi:hypothetical protein
VRIPGNEAEAPEETLMGLVEELFEPSWRLGHLVSFALGRRHPSGDDHGEP